MSISLLDPQRLARLETQNQYVPDEGPLALPLILSFTDASTTEFDLDLQNIQARGFLSMVQCAFIDCSQSTGALTLITANGFQNVVCKANTQGFYTLLCPNPVKIRMLGTAMMGKVVVLLCNVPIPGATWATA